MPGFEFGNLFKLSYWFSKPLTIRPEGLWTLGVIFGLVVIAAIVFTLMHRKAQDGVTRGVWRRFAYWAWTMSILGWLYFFARYEKMLIFQRRYWFALWFIGAAVWLYFVLRHARKRAPALNAKAKEQAFKERYLPKSKGKKR